MVRFLLALVVLFLGHAAAQDTGLSACSAGCISQVFSDTTTFGCAANDKVCACASPNFWFAVRDCITQACGSNGDLDQQLSDAQEASTQQCDAVTASAVSPAPSTTTTAPATTAVPASPTSTINTSPPTDTSKESAATDVASSTSSSTSTSTSTTSSETSSTTQATTPTPTTATTSTATPQTSSASLTRSSSSSRGVASSTSSSTSATSSASGTSSAGDNSPDEDSSSGQLSVAAKAGIGAGAGVALLLSAIIACYIMSKKRKAKQDPNRPPTMQISKPLPGSGRQYAHDLEAAKLASLSTQFRGDYITPIKTNVYSPSAVSSQYSPRSLYAPSRPSREDDYDVPSRRYEDMLPRTQPRTMI